jgi:hypothetical protein
VLYACLLVFGCFLFALPLYGWYAVSACGKLPLPIGSARQGLDVTGFIKIIQGLIFVNNYFYFAFWAF